MKERYTYYPRPILWLVRGGELRRGDSVLEVEPFYLSKFPVTNEQFEAYDPGFERSELSPGDDDPAVGVSWHEATEYCRWYAEIARKPMRLPTEVEWEYACRAGSEAKYFWGDDDGELERYVWHAGNSGGRPRPFTDKGYNDFGLYGMLGGVWEWTADGEGPAEPGRKVLRGGSYRTPAAEIDCTLRRPETPEIHADDVGFRLVKSFR
jgi:formylglycine-generating enzyme required for sulfatase activity